MTSIATECRMKPFDASMRCDRCGAQAFATASIPVEGEKGCLPLLFCGHHLRRHKQKLLAVSYLIDDRTSVMLPNLK